MSKYTVRDLDHWKFTKHVWRDDLAQEISESATPENVKAIASRVPPHLSGSCRITSTTTSKWILAQREAELHRGDS